MSDGDFVLDPRLAAETRFVVDWTLCRVLLMDEPFYPWLVLVPRRPGNIEMFDLGPQDQALLMEEIVNAGDAMRLLTGTPKINVGILGNIVPQLHVHIVARHEGDPAWPGPVWGHPGRRRYEKAALDEQVRKFVNAL